MNKFVSLMVSICIILFSGCATMVRIPGDEAKLIDAVSTNDAKAFKENLGNNTFISKQFILLNQNGFESINEADAYHLLDLAIVGRAQFFGSSRDTVARPACRTEIVQAIVDANLKLRPSDLSHAASAVCLNIVDFILSKLSAPDTVVGIDLFMNSMRLEMSARQLMPVTPIHDWDEIFESLRKSSTSEKKLELRQLRESLYRIAYQPREDAHFEKQTLERKYKMPMCSSPDLFNAAFLSGSDIRTDCFYGVGTGQMKVMQVIDGGILVRPANIYAPDKVIFVKTKKEYVDGDIFQNVYVKAAGIFKYQTAIGSGKTIKAFEYLGDTNPR